MLLQVLGYLGLALLVYLAAIWSLGVRFRLEAGLGIINGALFFVVCVVVLVATRANSLHAWWMVPAGYLLSIFIIPREAGNCQQLFLEAAQGGTAYVLGRSTGQAL